MTGSAQPSGLPADASGQLSLRHYDRQELERIRRDFEAGGSGVAALGCRTRLVDSLCRTLWDKYLSSQSSCSMAALGGFGRGELFPHSDVDLLFLAEDENGRDGIKDAVSALCQTLWDSGLRVSPVTRTLAECSRFDPENLEFTFS